MNCKIKRKSWRRLAASLLAGSFLRRCRPGEELEALASVTKQDLDDALQTMLRPERSATVVVDPA